MTVLQEDLDLHEVWLRYFVLTGSASEKELALYAVGAVMLPGLERDLAALALRYLIEGHPVHGK